MTLLAAATTNGARSRQPSTGIDGAKHTRGIPLLRSSLLSVAHILQRHPGPSPIARVSVCVAPATQIQDAVLARASGRHGRDGRFLPCLGATEWLEPAVHDDTQRQGTAWPATPKP